MFLLDCLAHMDDCFFAFSAMSDYDGIKFYPLILYPDVFPAYKHYKVINTASILGLVHGYLEEDTSPFHPEVPITRIQALKVILGAADLMDWKEKFELEGTMQDEAGAESAPEKWWYARYMDFARGAGIISAGEKFSPDVAITESELKEMIEKTLAYKNQ